MHFTRHTTYISMMMYIDTFRALLLPMSFELFYFICHIVDTISNYVKMNLMINSLEIEDHELQEHYSSDTLK